MSLALILDGVLILLLVVSIGYSAMLHRRLGSLRAARGEMQEAIQHFNQATQRAEAGISGLRSVGEEINRQIEPKLDDTRVLRDDLQLLVERGERAAERLEQGISAARKIATPAGDAAGKERKPASETAQLPAKRGKEDETTTAVTTSERVRPHRRSQREIELITALKSVEK